MVFRRHMRRARHSSSFYRRGKSSQGLKPMTLILGGAVYGAVRQYASNAIAPLTASIPLGNISDEVVLGTAGYLLATKTKGITRDIGRAALTIEAARIGEAVVTGQVMGGGTIGTFVYG